MQRLRILFRKLLGWELSVRAIDRRGRVLWGVSYVAAYRRRNGDVYLAIRTPNFRTSAVLPFPPGARLQEVWTKRSPGKAVRYGM